MRRILHFLFLMVLCLTLSTCCHDQEDEPKPCDCGEVNTIDELREWAYFKEGTYWIYEEETTLARDTFTVVNSHDFITDQGNVQFDYETYRSSDGYFYWFWFNEGWTAYDCNNDCCDCRRLWCDKYKAGDADGEDVLLTFPTFIGSYSYLWGQGEGGKTEVLNFFDSFSNSGYTFSSVALYNNNNSVLDQATQNLNWYATKYYYSKGFGIIRKEIEESNEVWDLIEFNIVQ